LTAPAPHVGLAGADCMWAFSAMAHSTGAKAHYDGERDHVHRLLHFPPKVAISPLVGSLKGVSARRLRRVPRPHPHPPVGEHFWSPSYFTALCRGAPLAVIKQYIENQKRPSSGQ
jgi:putative transposase